MKKKTIKKPSKKNKKLLQEKDEEREAQILDALKYADWCREHLDEIDPAEALWNIRRLILGCGRLVLEVKDHDPLPPPDIK